MNGGLLSKIKQAFKQAFPSIEKVSIALLIEAYREALTDKTYDLGWEEEQFSVYLVSLMKRSNLRTECRLTIDIEKKLIDYGKLPINKNNPKKIPRIDINIASWSFEENEELEYFFEAKNLCEIGWTKESKENVSASYYQNRYIDTGVENFRVGKYYNGSLVGYVLQGDTEKIIAKLNIQLKKDRKNYKAINSLSPIGKIDCVSNFSYCYSSKHCTDSKDELDIKHIFLKF